MSDLLGVMKVFKYKSSKSKTPDHRQLESARSFQSAQVDHHPPLPANHLSPSFPSHSYYPVCPAGSVCQLSTTHNIVQHQSTPACTNLTNQIRANVFETVQPDNSMIMGANLQCALNQTVHLPQYQTSQSVPIQSTPVCNYTHRYIENAYSNQLPLSPIAAQNQPGQQAQLDQTNYQLQQNQSHINGQYPHNPHNHQQQEQHQQQLYSNYLQHQQQPQLYHNHPPPPAQPQQQQAQNHQLIDRQSIHNVPQRSQFNDIRQYQSQILAPTSQLPQAQQQFTSQAPKLTQYEPMSANVPNQQQQYQNHTALKESVNRNEELSLEVLLMMYEKSKESLLERASTLGDYLQALSVELEDIRKETPAYVVNEARI